ncbi:hypothetical protein [Photobacterium leiognathi]|uniref:hypothetical protein n=1 Tax=Photobacterium leiognathi TaxID=553611 RepID=UPI00273A0A73|nr:hypothetical protein [Photobacterium leiognathi]
MNKAPMKKRIKVQIATFTTAILLYVGISPYVHAFSHSHLLNHADSYGNISLRNSGNITLPNPLVVAGSLDLENQSHHTTASATDRRW